MHSCECVHTHIYMVRKREDRTLTKCTVHGTLEINTMVVLKYTMVLEFMCHCIYCMVLHGISKNMVCVLNTMGHNQNTMVLP